MKIRMITDLGFGPFGRWPKPGDVGDVPAEYAEHAIEHGYAVPDGEAKPAETATAKPAGETRPARARRKPKG